MSLYLEHFGLKEAPFKITPHTEFFFSGGQRGALLQALHYAVMQEEGVIKVSGAVGSGKTMLCRMLGERLQNEADVIYLADPSLLRHEILDAIAADLRTLPAAEAAANNAQGVAPPTQRLRALQEQLIARYALGRRVVLLIDEAHAMPPESLEEIRLLSNLESNRHKLLQIVLFGQEELDQLLQTTAMRPLRDRITQTFRLSPFSPEEVANYLSFRLGAAGCPMSGVFTRTAAQMIAKSSGGLTRRINLLADKALLAAYSEGGCSVQPVHVKRALADCEFPAAVSARGLRWMSWLTLILSSAALGAMVVEWLPPRVALEKSATRPIKIGVTNPLLHPSGEQQGQPVVVSSMAAPQMLQRSLQEGLNWLAHAHDTQASLQLMVLPLSAQADIERFLQRYQQTPYVNALRAYRTTWNNAPAIVVLYGSYTSSTLATAALMQLPPDLRTLQPQVRLVREIRQNLRETDLTDATMNTGASTATSPIKPASN